VRAPRVSPVLSGCALVCAVRNHPGYADVCGTWCFRCDPHSVPNSNLPLVLPICCCPRCSLQCTYTVEALLQDLGHFSHIGEDGLTDSEYGQCSLTVLIDSYHRCSRMVLIGVRTTAKALESNLLKTRASQGRLVLLLHHLQPIRSLLSSQHHHPCPHDSKHHGPDG
jgi:hypothetical protein